MNSVTSWALCLTKPSYWVVFVLLFVLPLASAQEPKKDDGPKAKGGTVIAAGIDVFQTPPGSFHDFSSDPIPADFFFPGSQPFDGVVPFRGVPINPDVYEGGDTIVERLSDVTLNGPGTSDIAVIQIMALQLASVDPISVGSLTGSQPFNVFVQLSAQPQLQGDMQIFQNAENGGFYNSVLPVTPQFVFVPVGGGDPLVLDGGAQDPMLIVNLGSEGTPWSFGDGCSGLDFPAVPPLPASTTNFYPGYRQVDLTNECLCRLTPEEEMLAAHGIFPARFAAAPDFDMDGLPDECDNCPLVANTDQADLDGNEVGDVCEGKTNSVIPGGDDLWTTHGGTTFQDFSGSPIPGGFFGQGSLPFEGVVQLTGEPLDTTFFGNADTVVRRPLEADVSGGPATVPIEIVALSLTSVAPITVMFGTDPHTYDVAVDLSPSVPQEQGTITINKVNNNGGFFDSELPVIPRFTFQPIDPPGPPVMLDGGAVVPQIKIQLVGTQIPYVRGLNCPNRIRLLGVHQPIFPTSENFTPGFRYNDFLEKCQCELSQEEELLAAHGVFPARFAGQPDLDMDGIPDDCDNCWRVPNSDQADADNDRIGDVCEADCDANSNSILDWIDIVSHWLEPAAGNPGLDKNSDGVLNVFDLVIALDCQGPC